MTEPKRIGREDRIFTCPRCAGRGDVPSGGSRWRCNHCVGLGVCSDTLEYDDLLDYVITEAPE